MADFIWYPVTGDGQTPATAYTWNSASANWNTPADWGAANTLDLAAPPTSTGAVPGSGDNAYIVAGEIGASTISFYNAVIANPALGDPYIGSNVYAVDLIINSPVSLANLSLASFNQYADVPSYPTLDVQGSTLDVSGNVFASVSVVIPGAGTLSTNGGGTLALGGAGVVEIAGSVPANIDVAFLDGAGDRLVLGGVSPGATADFAGTIEGFVVGDTIDLSAVSYAGGQSSTINSGGTLTLTEGAQTYSLRFDPSLAGKTVLAAADSGSGTELTVACFASGARIMTARGEVAVEDLREGDLVATAEGTAPIVWLGHRRLDCRRHPRPWDVQPVRIAAGAFAPFVPRRDLVLSPDHAIFVDGALIPVRYLINGATITQEDVATVTYWHVELPEHGVLLAEGLPCESFLDTGNRTAFANGGTVAQIAPDFAPEVWAVQGCAPLVTKGEALLAARGRLYDRALAMGHALEADPGLHLLADGRVIRPASVSGRRYRFALDRACRTVRLASRAARPAEANPESGDRRRLGVMVTRLALRRGDTRQEIPLGALDGAGWHAVEGEGAWRWTDGHAALPLAATAPLELEVELGGWARPWRQQASASTRARA